MELETLTAITWRAIAPLAAVGAALHFLYGWSGRRRAAAIFGAVNESYWEHIKIALWPIFFLQAMLYGLGGYRYDSFVPAATISLYSIPVTITGAVFLYKFVTRRNVLALDIGVFCASIAIAQSLFVRLLEQMRPDTFTLAFAWIYLAGLLGALLRFTLRPPAEPDLFVDPITGEYGVPHND